MSKVYRIKFRGGDGTDYIVRFKSNRSYFKDLKFNLWCIICELRRHWHTYRLAKQCKKNANI